MIHAPENLRIPGLKVGRHQAPITVRIFQAEVAARYSWAWDEHKKRIASLPADTPYLGMMKSGYATNGFARDLDDWKEEFDHLPAALRSTHDSSTD